MRLVGVVLHRLRRDGLQGGKQPLRTPFAFCLVGGVVVSERVRRGVAQPEQVFQFESASGGDAVGDAVVAAVGRAAVVFFVYVLAEVAVVCQGRGDGRAVLQCCAFVGRQGGEAFPARGEGVERLRAQVLVECLPLRGGVAVGHEVVFEAALRLTVPLQGFVLFALARGLGEGDVGKQRGGKGQFGGVEAVVRCGW